MVNNSACYCENCGRANDTLQMNKITVNQHTALLCLACTHILTSAKNEQRFIHLVRSKSKGNASSEMREVHRLLSAMLVVGTVFLAATVTVGTAYYYDLTLPAIREIQAASIGEVLAFYKYSIREMASVFGGAANGRFFL